MKRFLISVVTVLFCLVSAAQQRLSVGGYGEVAMSRHLFSDHVYRYTSSSSHTGEQHGRFDIPHAVIYLGYDFGKGWTMQSEIEFEHTGTGTAVEKEFEEAGEWESEIEKGGEVELEQFWIQKSFFPGFNVRMGHMVVPVGGLNNAHEPLNFFTVYRPEGEYTILPSTWHDTGISIWGRTSHWRYEAQLIAGLDAYMFSRDNFIKKGAGSPFEFKVANRYGFVGRLDNYSVRDLRMGLSGYYGHSMHNTYPYEKLSDTYADVKGRTAFAALEGSDITFGENLLGAAAAGSTYATWQEAAAKSILNGSAGIADEVANTKIGTAHYVHSGSYDADYIESPYSHRSYYDFRDNILSIQYSLYGSAGATSAGAKSLMKFLKDFGYSGAATLESDLKAAIASLETCIASGVAFVENPQSELAEKAIVAINKLCDDLGDAADWIVKL